MQVTNLVIEKFTENQGLLIEYCQNVLILEKP